MNSTRPTAGDYVFGQWQILGSSASGDFVLILVMPCSVCGQVGFCRRDPVREMLEDARGKSSGQGQWLSLTDAMMVHVFYLIGWPE